VLVYVDYFQKIY